MKKSTTILILTLILGIFCFRCNTIRQARNEKLDKRAFSRVINSPTLLNKVTQFGNSLHPVTMYPIYVKGKDSLIYAYKGIYHDTTLYKYLPSNINRDSLIDVIRRSFKPDTIHRTDIQIIKDTNCTQQFQILQAQFYDMQGQSRQKDIQIKTLEDKSNKKGKQLFIVLLSAILIILGLTILLFKK